MVLAESQSGVSYNFGYVKPISVGGTVYEDTQKVAAFDEYLAEHEGALAAAVAARRTA